MTRRSERVGEEIREEVARMVGRLKDPRIGFVTVTRVEITADLRQARIHVGVLGDTAQKQKTMAGLEQAAGFLRRGLGQALRMRHTPELVFSYDEGLAATERVAQLLDEVHAAPTSEDVAAEAVDGHDDEDDDQDEGGPA